MAREAPTIFGHCFVRTFQRHVFIRMTSKTEGVAGHGQQRLTLRGMGIVTGIALAIFKGRMLLCTTGLQRFGFVAFQAEATALPA